MNEVSIVLWCPKLHDRICSAHFIGGEKADEQDSPSYVSRIFPATYPANVLIFIMNQMHFK